MHKFHAFVVISAMTIAAAGCSGGKAESDSDAAIHNVFVVEAEAVGATTENVFPATVEEARTISVGFKTAGQIERIFVREGQRVDRGQLLALLDTVDYALGISTLREKYRQLAIETERRERLHASGNMSDNDYENALSGLRQLSLQLRLEENKLDYCRLKSPSAGIITKINFENSEMVDAGTPVIELMDNSRLEAVVDLPVRNFAASNAADRFYAVSPLEGGKPVELTFLSLTPKADNSQLYTLRLALPANCPGVTPGMNLSVKIVGNGRTDGEGTVSVPLTALFDRGSKTYVWTVNPADSTLTATEVSTTGTAEQGRAEITSGLAAGSLVVRAGVHHLTDGERVNILPEDSATNLGNVL